MKHEITTKTRLFEPIEVKITVQSMAELLELTMRFNISPKILNDHGNLLQHHDRVDSHQYEKVFWDLQKIYSDLA